MRKADNSRKKKKKKKGRGTMDLLAGVRLIGMVHLPTLPGAPGHKTSMRQIVDRAICEAEMLAGAGFDAIVVENFGDAPFASDRVPPETIAAMSIVSEHIVQAVDLPVGVNILRNDALAAMAVASIAGAAFIRVNVLSGTYATDQGLITGRAHELLRLRDQLQSRVQIAADVHVKHAVPISQPDIALAAEETAYRAGADAIIVSGSATGSPTDMAAVRRVHASVPDRPVWIGSGVTAETVEQYLEIASAVIVGTCLKRGGRTTAPIDQKRLGLFTKAAGRG